MCSLISLSPLCPLIPNISSIYPQCTRCKTRSKLLHHTLFKPALLAPDTKYTHSLSGRLPQFQHNFYNPLIPPTDAKHIVDTSHNFYIIIPSFPPPHPRTDSKHIVNGPHDFYTINRQNNDRANQGASRASHVILYCIFMIGFAMVSVMFLIKLAIDTACMHGCIFNSVPGLNHRCIYISN